jgi:hypothetical protein
MSEPLLPPAISTLADELSTMPGTVAVVLGGSRAMSVADPGSDWDLGVYYRGRLDTSRLAARGTVYEPGSWGRVMNGGAWLNVEDTKVDVLLRDLDVVEHWSNRALEGLYEVDALLGYVAGVPTYSLLAERAVARVLRGSLTPIDAFPERLAAVASERWRFHSRFSLDHARMRALRRDVVGTVGQAAKAVIEHAHALLCERRQWVLNEKRIIERAGLDATQELFVQMPRREELEQWLVAVSKALSNA